MDRNSRVNRVIELLENHADAKKQITLLEFELASFQAVDELDIIESLAVSKPTGEYIRTGRTSNRTMNLAVRLEDIRNEIEDESFQQINAELLAVREKVERLETYISLLSEKEACVIQKFYIEKKSWKEINEDTGYSFKTLTKWRDSGIQRLADMYEFVDSIKRKDEGSGNAEKNGRN